MEKGETSNSRKKERKWEEDCNSHSSWETYKNETMNHRSHAKASGIWTKNFRRI